MSKILCSDLLRVLNPVGSASIHPTPHGCTSHWYPTSPRCSLAERVGHCQHQEAKITFIITGMLKEGTLLGSRSWGGSLGCPMGELLSAFKHCNCIDQQWLLPLFFPLENAFFLPALSLMSFNYLSPPPHTPAKEPQRGERGLFIYWLCYG